MPLTAPEVVAIASALGVLIAAIGAVIVNVIIALRTGKEVTKTGDQVRETATAIAEVSAKTDVINGHVNSAASKSAEQIIGLQAQLALLQQQLSGQKEHSALLAQSLGAAASGTSPVPVPDLPPPPPPPTDAPQRLA
jgi:uncharacterized phage infection (PIP) family protein YhgE